MSNKSSRQRANHKADDFRIIRGLPKTARARLHAAGVLTFAQLAAMSPHEIVAAVGETDETSAEQIIREDWIGQAAALAAPCETATVAAAEQPAEPPSPPLAIAPNPDLTSFVLELKLNEDKTVRQTRVMHVESEEGEAEKKWSGWDEMRLLNFIVHRAKIALPAPSPQPAKTMPEMPEVKAEVSVEERLEQLEAKAALASVVKVNTLPIEPSLQVVEKPDAKAAFEPAAQQGKLEVFAGEFGAPTGVAQSGGNYSIKVSLPSAEVESPRTASMAYALTVYAKSLTPGAAKQHLVIGESQGVVAPPDNLEFNLEGAALAPGAYRMQATARFRPLGDALGAGANASRNYTTFVEGGVLQVY